MLSALDNDIYKFLMQQLIVQRYPDISVRYRFINRRLTDKLGYLAPVIKRVIQGWKDISFSDEELTDLSVVCAGFSNAYLSYLKGYKFNPDEIYISNDNGDLSLSIDGKWHKTILWEVPLMALISELHFANYPLYSKEGVFRQATIKAREKGIRLRDAGCVTVDFSTRRRRSAEIHQAVLEGLLEAKALKGISNVHFARKYGLKAIGTVAHEFYMGMSAIHSINHPNRFAMQEWLNFYKGLHATAIPDTFGSTSFFKDFDLPFAKAFDAVKHDSGDPFVFTDRLVAHYDKLGIDPSTKTIAYCDALTVDKAIQIQGRYEFPRKIYGIGTHFSNDFEGSPALNMVIKLDLVDRFPVVKLSDESGKACGNLEMVKMMKYLHLPPS